MSARVLDTPASRWQPEEDCCPVCAKRAARCADALRAILAAWSADLGGNALRSAPALVEAIAQARKVVGE